MIQELPTTNIHPSPLNPRKTFGDLTDLANSIKTQGVLQNLLVRPSTQEGHYILISGERRLRAATQAGVSTVPAKILDIDETQALELTILENDQREDIHPLDQALGYEALMDRGRTIEEIAAKTGRTLAYVRHRLKLTTLTEEWREIVQARKTTIEAALLLASLPHDAQQSLRTRLGYSLVGYGTKATLEDIRTIITPQWVQQEVRHSTLANVPWDLADSKLDKKAGACTTCPKSTLSQPDLWQEATGHCFDDECRANKFKLHYTAKAKAENLLPVSNRTNEFDILYSEPTEDPDQYTKALITEGYRTGETVYVRRRPTSDQTDQEALAAKREAERQLRIQQEAERNAALAKEKTLRPLIVAAILDHVKANPLDLGDLAPLWPAIIQGKPQGAIPKTYKAIGLPAAPGATWDGKPKAEFPADHLAQHITDHPDLAPLAVAAWLLEGSEYVAYDPKPHPLLTAWAYALNIDPEVLLAEHEQQKAIKSQPKRKEAKELPSDTGENP